MNPHTFTYLFHIISEEYVLQIGRDRILRHVEIDLVEMREKQKQRYYLNHDKSKQFDLKHDRLIICTHKCCVRQDYLRFICDDVELDDVAITVSVDDFRVCV